MTFTVEKSSPIFRAVSEILQKKPFKLKTCFIGKKCAQSGRPDQTKFLIRTVGVSEEQQTLEVSGCLQMSDPGRL
jgi:hypothetical protein